MSDAIGYTVLHAKRKGDPTGPKAFADFKDSDLLLPLEVRDPIAPEIPAAKLRVNLESVSDWCWNWKRHLAFGDLVAVVSDHPKASDRKVPFCGFVADVDWTFDREQELIVTAVGMPFRLARDRAHLVHGRWMETSDSATVAAFTGLPAVFNAAGRPNRSASAYTNIEGAPDEGIHCFTGDADPNAEFWSVTDALEYLLWYYNAAQDWLTNPAFTTDDFAATLSQAPVQIDVEGLGLWDALAAVAEQGGYDLACRYAYGDTITGAIRLIRKDTGTLQILDHQSPGDDGSFPTMDADKTNLFAASVAEATASCVTTPVVAGARPLYEITVELGKAWHSVDLALPSGARVVMPGHEKANATNDYVKRYVTTGSDFADYASAGRLFDANTDGFFSGWPYVLTVTDVAALADQTAGKWPKMNYKPRPMLTKIAAGDKAAGQEYCVEYTIDGGTNWQTLGKNHCRVMGGCLGVYISAANLAEIYPDGGNQVTDNLFQKLLDAPSSVKVRLTCCIASPHRNGIAPDRRVTAGSPFNQTALFDEAAAGAVRVRATSSRFYGSGSLTPDECDDSARLGTFAAAAQDVNEDRFVEAGLTIEQITPDIHLGDRVERIGGIEVDLQTNAGAAKRRPRIVCRTFRFEPDTYNTELTLDTERKQPVL